MILRDATVEDEAVIKDLYLKLLKETKPFGMDVEPTEANVEVYWKTFLEPVAAGGEGALLIADDGVPAGALFWPVLATPFVTSEKSATGLGVYVEKAFRGERLATAMREAALAKLSKQGIKSVLGFVHSGNEPGAISAKRAGAVEVGTIVKFPTHA